MATRKQGKRYRVTDEAGTTIGKATRNDDGSITIGLTLVPQDGFIVLAPRTDRAPSRPRLTAYYARLCERD